MIVAILSFKQSSFPPLLTIMKYPKLFASSIYLFTFANIELKPESTVVELNIPKRFTVKRDAKAGTQVSNFTWPNFDGTPESFTNDDLLE